MLFSGCDRGTGPVSHLHAAADGPDAAIPRYPAKGSAYKDTRQNLFRLYNAYKLFTDDFVGTVLIYFDLV